MKNNVDMNYLKCAFIDLSTGMYKRKKIDMSNRKTLANVEVIGQKLVALLGLSELLYKVQTT